MASSHRPRNQKVCARCGNKFWPNSGVQKYCKDCGPPKPKAKPRKTKAKAKPTPRRRSREREIAASVQMRMGMRLAAIDRESYERFREERDGG